MPSEKSETYVKVGSRIRTGKEMANKDEAGIDKRWLKALATSELEKPRTFTVNEIKEMSGARKPQSKIQLILQNFYYELQDRMRDVYIEEDEAVGPDEDMFDGWYEENELEHYTNRYNLMQAFNSIAQALHLGTEESYGKRDFETMLSRIASRCLAEREYVEKIKEVINEKYDGLIGDFRYTPSLESMNEQERAEYEQKVHKIEQRIESNIEEFQDIIDKIKVAEKTDFEKTAQLLNQIVIVGEAIWELTLYATMSPYAPRVLINNLDYRANIHEMLAGDISTAKSKIHKILKVIGPKVVPLDETTKPTFEGVAPTRTGDDIEEGVLDWAKDGIIIVEEFTRRHAGMPLFRRGMDCEDYAVYKKGSKKIRDVNSTWICACNPNEDFFQTEMEFRRQIPFKEGVLSRFDVLIPLTATQDKNDLIVDQMDLFGTKTDEIDFDAIKEQLVTLSAGMRDIKQVALKEEQKQMLRNVFKEHNDRDRKQRLLKNRPLVILRDLETLARFVNIIATVNFPRRKISRRGVLWAEDEDIEKAIQLWENLLQFRVQLYTRAGDRNLRTVSDEICLFMWRSEGQYREIPIQDVYNEIVLLRRLVGQTTFYKEIKNLVETGRLAQFGQRDRKLKLIIR